MTDIKRIGSAGVHTVEGNVAGSRAARSVLIVLILSLIFIRHELFTDLLKQETFRSRYDFMAFCFYLLIEFTTVSKIGI